MSLKHTRAILDAIHSTDEHALIKAPTTNFPVFNLQIPTKCHNVPSEILVPRLAWKDTNAYDAQLKKLGSMFIKKFEEYKSQASKAILDAGPKV